MSDLFKNVDYTYKYLIDFFGEKKIEDRYIYIYSKMQDFLKAHNITDYIKINGCILEQVIIDYFADIYRLKDFHDINKVNKRKIISCETFWILKRKPLQFVDENNCFGLFINERFIMSYLTLEFLFPNVTITPPDNTAKIIEEYLGHLFYHLKYRYIDQQYLELVLYSFEMGKHLCYNNDDEKK